MPEIRDKWHDIEVEDDVTAYVEYENGATGVFITSTGDACGTNRLEIQMDKAKIIAHKNALEITEYEMSEQEFSAQCKTPFGHMEMKTYQPETDGENLQHVGIIRAWGGAILRNEPLIADGKEGIRGLMLSNAMHLSDWLKQPVELPLDEDLYYEELMKRVENSRKKDSVKSVISDVESTYGSTPTGVHQNRWNTNW